MSKPTIEERILDINAKGYKVVISTHSAGRYEWLEEHVPSKHGHWTITYNDPEDGTAYCRGFMVDAEVGYSWAQARGRTSLHYGAVLATIHDCLDGLEKRIEAQEQKIAEKHPDRCPSCEYIKGHGWGCPVYEDQKAGSNG